MTRADIAIVGAGIVGCLTACEIVARAPRVSVVLLDRDTVGSGASRRSAGLHLPRGATERVRRMAAYSQDYYARLKRRTPGLPIHQLPMSVVASASSDPPARESYLDSAGLARAAGVSGDDLRIPDTAEVWTGEGCQYADVSALTQALTRELRPWVGVREGVRVTAVDQIADGVELRLGTGDVVSAGQVVLAPGPWVAAPAWRELVAPLGVRVKKVVALHVDRVPAGNDRVIVFQDEDAFLLPLERSGYWLFSYTCTEWDVDPDTVAGGLSPTDLKEAQECLRRYAPALADRATSGRVFCDAYSLNREPLVTALDPGARIVFAGAANGSGYRLAPAIASEAVDLLRIPRSEP